MTIQLLKIPLSRLTTSYNRNNAGKHINILRGRLNNVICNACASSQEKTAS